MLRQIATPAPNGGTVLRYVDLGPRSAVCGHGRPMFSSKHSTGGGARQIRLSTDLGGRG